MADLIEMSTTLWIGADWIVVTAAIVISLRVVRRFQLRPIEQELAPAPLLT